jgi:hypothetical protein
METETRVQKSSSKSDERWLAPAELDDEVTQLNFFPTYEVKTGC